MAEQRRRRSSNPVLQLLLGLTGLVRNGVPTVSLIVAACIGVATLGSPALNALWPQLIYPVAFFWLVQRQGHFSFLVLFVIGLLTDLLTGGPLGLTSLGLLALYGATASRDFTYTRQPEKWLLFAALMTGIVFAHWLIISLLSWSFRPSLTLVYIEPSDSILRLLATILTYPVIMVLLLPVERLFFGRRDL